MVWKDTMLRKMTVVMLAGVLLSPFVSNANDVAGHGSQPLGNTGAGNHMVVSGQFNNDLDMTNIVMDDEHMSGNSLHTNNGNGYMEETSKTVITKGNNGSRNLRTNGSRTWDDHHQNDHMGISQLRMVDLTVAVIDQTEPRTITPVAVEWVACINFSLPATLFLRHASFFGAGRVVAVFEQSN